MITLSACSLRRGTKLLFENANLSLFQGQKIALVGANGCGKSSLFALLKGELSADSGEVQLPNHCRLAFMAQETPGLAVPAIEYVKQGHTRLYDIEQAIAALDAAANPERISQLYQAYEDLDGYRFHTRAAELLHGLGFQDEEFQQPVSAFSGGWRVRLNLAQALIQPAELLLLDEPTNHLDLDTIIWLEKFLQQHDGTLILISHDRDFLDNVCDTTVHLEQQQLHLYAGNYSSFEKQRAEKLILQQAQYEKQQKHIAHMQSFVDRFRAKASKAKQAQSRLKAIAKLEIINAVRGDSTLSFQFKPIGECPNPLIQLSDGILGYGEKHVLDNVKFSLSPGDRIGLLGPNGAGKSTLIKALTSGETCLSGNRLAAGGAKIGYFAQHQLEQLHAESTPLIELQQQAPKHKESALRAYLGQFGFSNDMVNTPIERFSGGEKARLVLALLVWHAPNLILLDEPTNHLDMGMRDSLNLALQQFEGTVVLVSHDRYLLTSVCDSFYLVANQQVQAFSGDLSDYQRWLTQYRRSLRETSQEKKPSAKKVRQAEQIQRQIETIEKKLATTATAINELKRALAEPAMYDAENARQLQEVQTQLAKQQKQQTTLEDEWTQLQDQLES